MMKYIFVFLLGLCPFINSCKEKKEKKATEVFPVTSPIIIDTNTSVDYVAEIYAVQYVEIRAKAPGYLEKVHVDEGSFVQKGQLLFSINDREYAEALAEKRALLKMAQAEANSTELDLINTKSLVDKNIVSKIEYEFALNKVNVARAKVEGAHAEEAQAEQKLSYTAIRAPFSGTINRIPHKIGSLIEQGALLTSLSQNDEVYTYFDVSEKEYLNYMSDLANGDKKEREVMLILANGQTHRHVGTIETVDGQVDGPTGNISFRARFKNSSKILKHGASGKVRIEKYYKNALIIPQKSTLEIQDKVFVYVIDKHSTARMRQVEIEARIPHFYILSKGLTTEDKIIYEGLQTINEGMKIDPRFISIKKIIHDLSAF